MAPASGENVPGAPVEGGPTGERVPGAAQEGTPGEAAQSGGSFSPSLDFSDSRNSQYTSVVAF